MCYTCNINHKVGTLKILILLTFLIPIFTQDETRPCERRRYGFSIRSLKDGKASSLHTLTLSNGQKATVRLRKFSGREGKDIYNRRYYLSGNCFAFASHQGRNIPGSKNKKIKSPVNN